MALNCIIDDSALLAGLGLEGKDNLRQWVRQGSVNLYVPLHALDRLVELKDGAADSEAREALEWLDHITTVTSANRCGASGKVQLQDGRNRYYYWDDVEKWLLPETPFSRDNLVDLADDLNDGLHLNNPRKVQKSSKGDAESGYLLSPASSPDRKQRGSAAEEQWTVVRSRKKPRPLLVPDEFQELVNFVVWRTHNNEDESTPVTNYIMVTNEPRVQQLVQRFGVRAKSLAELSRVVQKSVESLQVNETPENEQADEEDAFESASLDGDDRTSAMPEHNWDDILERKLNGGWTALVDFGLPPRSPPPNIIDPDHFGRDLTSVVPAGRRQTTGSRGSPRGQTHVRGRGGFVGGGQNLRGNQGSPKAHGYNARGARGSGLVRRPQVDERERIDPDSYNRPSTRPRGRGFQKRLFDPNGS